MKRNPNYLVLAVQACLGIVALVYAVFSLLLLFRLQDISTNPRVLVALLGSILLLVNSGFLIYILYALKSQEFSVWKAIIILSLLFLFPPFTPLGIIMLFSLLRLKKQYLLHSKSSMSYIKVAAIVLLNIPVVLITFLITWYISANYLVFPSSENLARQYIQTLIDNDRDAAAKLSRNDGDCIENTLVMWDSDHAFMKVVNDRDVLALDIRIARSLGSFEERQGVYVLPIRHAGGLNKGISLYTRYHMGNSYGFTSRRYICGSLPSEITDALSSTYEYIYSEGTSFNDRKTYFVRVGYDGITVRIEERNSELTEKPFFIYPGDFYNFEKTILSAELQVNGQIPDLPCSAYTMQRLSLHSTKINIDGATFRCPNVDISSSNKIIVGNLTGNIDKIISAINSLNPNERIPTLPSQ